MKPAAILQSDILDIIFEKRNKTYGAYTLRKYYNERVYKAMGISVLITAFISLLILSNKKKFNPAIPISDPEYGFFKIPEEPVTPPQLSKLTLPVKSVHAVVPLTDQKQVQVNSASNRIVFSPDATKIENTVSTYTGIEAPNQLAAAGNVQTTLSTNVQDGNKPLVDKNTPRESVDIMPAYPGGLGALQKFLEKNLSTPKNIENGETVSVTIKFVVGYDGVLKSFEILQDGGAVYNNEVIRVLKKMPAWIPGKAHGENVSVYYAIPVKFTSAE